MLTAINLGNFKAFADTQHIPLRPITLIYGANSSGKSSIIHSLALAHQALEADVHDGGRLDVHRTKIGGDSIDLGGFAQFIHRRQANQKMEWSVELDSSRFAGRLAELFAPVKTIMATIRIGMPLDDQDRPLASSYPRIEAYEVHAGGRLILKMSARKEGILQLENLDHEHPVFREIMKSLVLSTTTAETVQASDFEGLAETIDALIPNLSSRIEHLFPETMLLKGKSISLDPGMLMAVGKGTRKDDLTSAATLYFPRILNEMIGGIAQTIAAELRKLQYLGPLRSYPPRHLAFAQNHDPNWFAGGGYAWDVVRTDAAVRSKVNEWLNAKDRLQTPYELVIRELVGLEDLERPLSEAISEIDDEGEPEFIDEDNQFINGPAYRDVFPDVEAMTERFIKVIRDSGIDRLPELMLIDRSRGNTPVSHRDVGIGISQVLPVLVAAYASNNRTIAIEQPEIHLHPALQADLGDVIIETALGEQHNRFVLETHSEHLLLRVMRRMRETSEGRLPEGVRAVKPADVAVVFVQPKGSASVIRQLELDEDGQLLDPWPGGFFEEGFRERFS